MMARASGEENSPLQYDSMRPAALRPGEVVLWQAEGAPQLAEPFRGIARLDAKTDWSYFVTDQRVIAAEQTGTSFAVHDRANQPPVSFISIQGVGAKVANVSVSSILRSDRVTLKYVQDWRGLCRVVGALPRKTSRYFMHRGRWTKRRGRRVEISAGKSRGTNMNTQENLDVNELPLLDGEKIEWSGRPQKWKSFSLAAFGSVAWTLIWLTVPVGVVVLRLELAPTEWTVNWFIFVPAAIWVVAALYRLLIKPFVDASKRARTRYFLTNIRAFVLEARGQNRNIEIVFLDGLGPTSKLTEKSDGSGDVSIGHQLIFQGIRDARPVHQMIMQAIQGADGTFEGERR